MRYTIAGIIIACLLGFVLLLLNSFSSSRKEEIASGELQYTCHCGWVNWDHALPKGPQLLIDQLVNSSHAASTITYGQRMKIPFFGLGSMVADLQRTYAINKDLTLEDRKQIAYFIFVQTSNHFEQMQSELLWGFEPVGGNSSFKDGDLMGNRIAFYRALQNYSKLDIEKFCRPVGKDTALALWNEKKSATNATWEPIYQMTNGKFPSALTEIRADSTTYNKFRFLKETRKIYWE